MAPDPAPPPHAVLDVDKEGIGFAAAHFSILEGGSERIHGHNYRVALRAAGTVRRDGTLVDFAALKAALRAECDLLDHRMLLPGECPEVAIERLDDGHLEVREGSRRFVFPEAEVRVLPVPNTTCECLAAHLLDRVRARLGELPVRLEVRVDESPGQGATVGESRPG
ncbi:MAG TPA: 6-carboxytetrahydropterin synthase [Candidatus Angelobacter sp.]|jgi:6-pyruvoyl-tetrahydropterin synthase|nr:6-carboxytetrahydropterin synthase [Candidatus Angelobacter sp.]